jgi:hypothetical protein
VLPACRLPYLFLAIGWRRPGQLGHRVTARLIGGGRFRAGAVDVAPEGGLHQRPFRLIDLSHSDSDGNTTAGVTREPSAVAESKCEESIESDRRL